EMDGKMALKFYPRLLKIIDLYLGAGEHPDWVNEPETEEEAMEVAGMQVKVHVLDNGQRVIAAEDAEKLFQWLAAAPEGGNGA
ncbi:hypothetical protein ACB374_23420, partial [Serratia marcescens]